MWFFFLFYFSLLCILSFMWNIFSHLFCKIIYSWISINIFHGVFISFSVCCDVFSGINSILSCFLPNSGASPDKIQCLSKSQTNWQRRVKVLVWNLLFCAFEIGIPMVCPKISYSYYLSNTHSKKLWSSFWALLLIVSMLDILERDGMIQTNFWRIKDPYYCK